MNSATSVFFTATATTRGMPNTRRRVSITTDRMLEEPCEATSLMHGFEAERRGRPLRLGNHGEGSIYQRSDGRWAATITLEGRKRKTFYGKTRKEVAAKLNKAIQEQKQGILATGPQQTLEQYLTRWLEEVHRPTIRESTYLNYRRFLNNHILPALGHIYLNKLTPQLVQSFYTQKLQEGLAPGSVRDMHMVLHKALENAVRWRLI